MAEDGRNTEERDNADPPAEHLPTLPALLAWSADRFGDEESVVGGTERLTYREVERRSARWARGLLASGVGKGTRVGILMPNGPDFVVAFLATTRIGAIAVPLSTLYQARELADVLHHADVHTLLTVARYRSHDYVEKLESAAPDLVGAENGPLCVRTLPALRAVRVWGACPRAWARSEPAGLEHAAEADPAIERSFLDAAEGAITPADPAVIIYTSGSSGTPKGVVHTHGTLVRHTHLVSRSFHNDLHPGDRVYSTQPLFWVGGLSLCLLGCLRRGATLHCDATLDDDAILDLVERERITHVLAMGHTSRALLSHPRMATGDFSFVRFGLVRRRDENGAPVPVDRIPNRLGMTESFGLHSLEPSGTLLPPAKAGSFGRGIPGVDRRVVDPETREPCPPGELGELWVRGFSLMQDSYKRDRATVFEPDGFYRTGDLCRLDEDGYIYFEGRRDELVKVRGANVSLREIEVVLESFAEVDRAGVVGFKRSEGTTLVAAISLAPGAATTADEIQTRLRGELSAYKVPAQVVILAGEALPLTASEKVRKTELKRLLEHKLG